MRRAPGTISALRRRRAGAAREPSGHERDADPLLLEIDAQDLERRRSSRRRPAATIRPTARSARTSRRAPAPSTPGSSSTNAPNSASARHAAGAHLADLVGRRRLVDHGSAVSCFRPSEIFCFVLVDAQHLDGDLVAGLDDLRRVRRRATSPSRRRAAGPARRRRDRRTRRSRAPRRRGRSSPRRRRSIAGPRRRCARCSLLEQRAPRDDEVPAAFLVLDDPERVDAPFVRRRVRCRGRCRSARTGRRRAGGRCAPRIRPSPRARPCLRPAGRRGTRLRAAASVAAPRASFRDSVSPPAVDTTIAWMRSPTATSMSPVVVLQLVDVDRRLRPCRRRRRTPPPGRSRRSCLRWSGPCSKRFALSDASNIAAKSSDDRSHLTPRHHFRIAAPAPPVSRRYSNRVVTSQALPSAERADSHVNASSDSFRSVRRSRTRPPGTSRSASRTKASASRRAFVGLHAAVRRVGDGVLPAPAVVIVGENRQQLQRFSVARGVEMLDEGAAHEIRGDDRCPFRLLPRTARRRPRGNGHAPLPGIERDVFERPHPARRRCGAATCIATNAVNRPRGSSGATRQAADQQPIRVPDPSSRPAEDRGARAVRGIEDVGAVADARRQVTVGDERIERERHGVPRQAETPRDRARRRHAGCPPGRVRRRSAMPAPPRAPRHSGRPYRDQVGRQREIKIGVACFIAKWPLWPAAGRSPIVTGRR